MALAYEVCVDWDMTNWTATPDFTGPFDNISNDIMTVKWVRGEVREDGNSPASTLELRIKGSLYAKYSIFNQYGDLYQKLLPWRVVRVRAVLNGTPYNVFFGFISKIKVNPHLGAPEVYIYCTDGLDLLARAIINQDWQNRIIMTDGDAVDTVLNAAGWSAGRRDIDIDGGEIFQYPVVTGV